RITRCGVRFSGGRLYPLPDQNELLASGHQGPVGWLKHVLVVLLLFSPISSLFSAFPAFFSPLPAFLTVLSFFPASLLAGPFLNAFSNEFSQVFDLLGRLAPEIFERFGIKSYSISPARSSMTADLIFVVGRELSAGHCRYRQ